MGVAELEATLERELSLVRAAARRPDGWRDVLERYRIAAAPPPGPPTVAQLRLVVNALVLQCAAALEQAPDGKSALALWQRLTRVVDEEGRAHAEWLGPPWPPSQLLGNILRNATASVHDELWARFQWSERLVALCKTCGAPQQKARDYRCRYCGGDMFRGAETSGGDDGDG
jgi:hypothetical protein